jgi:hypothetical protein
MTVDITPKFKIPSSGELPGGVLDTSSDSSQVVSSGSLIQPKKEVSTGGMQAGATTLTQGSGNDIFKVSSLGIHLGAAEFINAPFSVNMQGDLIATSGHFSGDITGASGTFSGTITATSGTIGGFTITSTSLYGGIIKTAATVGAGTTGVIMDTAGLRGYDSVLGNTFNLPTNGSAPTFSSGIINSTVFNINTSAVLRTSDTVGDGTASSAGILENNTGLYACEANQTLANANVKILINGTANFKGAITATSGTFTGITAATINVGATGSIYGGQTAYNTGSGFWMGYDTSAYKLSIGNPAGDYFTWDGTNMTISGVQKIINRYTADEDLAIGTSVGISNYISGSKVARALRKTVDTTTSFSFGGGVPSFSENESAVQAIGGDKFVFGGYSLTGDTLWVTIGVIDPDTKTVSLGTSVAVTTDSDTYYSICKLDTDKFIVIYKEDADTTLILYRVGTVSGSTITLGSAGTFYDSGSNIGIFRLAQIGTDKGVAVFGTSGADNGVIAFTVSGTTATMGTRVQMGNTMDNDMAGLAICKVDTDKFIFGTKATYCQVGTISGTTITLGSEVNFTSVSMNSNYFEVVSPSTNVAVFRYQNGSNQECLIACTISGTVPTFGSEVGGTNQYGCGIIVENSTTLLTGNFSDNRIKKYTLSGNTLTVVGNVINTVGAHVLLRMLDAGYWVGFIASNDVLTTIIQGMTNNFIGLTDSTVSRGDTVPVVVSGKVSGLSGLITGGMYQVTSTGLTFVSSNVTLNSADDIYLIASSTTEIIL